MSSTQRVAFSERELKSISEKVQVEALPDFVDEIVPTNMAYWFARCSELTSIEHITNLKTNKVTDMSDLFIDCSKLETIDVSSLNTSNVTSFFNMFCYCSNLKSIDISNWDTRKVTTTVQMFNGCENLESINFGSIDGSNIENMGGMFMNCKKLSQIDLSWINSNKLNDFQQLFLGCETLSQITGLDKLGKGKTSNLMGMFQNCKALTSVDISDIDYSEVNNINWMFLGAENLLSIYVGDSWNYNNLTYKENVFSSTGTKFVVRKSDKRVLGIKFDKGNGWTVVSGAVAKAGNGARACIMEPLHLNPNKNYTVSYPNNYYFGFMSYESPENKAKVNDPGWISPGTTYTVPGSWKWIVGNVKSSPETNITDAMITELTNGVVITEND